MLLGLLVVGIYLAGFFATVAVLAWVDGQPEEIAPLALFWPVTVPLILLYLGAMALAEKIKEKVDRWRR